MEIKGRSNHASGGLMMKMTDVFDAKEEDERRRTEGKT